MHSKKLQQNEPVHTDNGRKLVDVTFNERQRQYWHDTRLKTGYQPDRFSDSIRNKNFSDEDVRNFARKNGLDENAFMEKFNSYNDTFKASTQLGSQLQRTDALVATTRDFSEQK